MKHLRAFESFGFDYKKIERLIQSKGWGQGAMQLAEKFEQDQEYYKQPVDEFDYSEQFHIFLVDALGGQHRSYFRNRNPIILGSWKIGPSINSPTSIYNKLT